MAIATDSLGGGPQGHGRLTFAIQADRARAFRSAQRHTVLVRLLKVVLPVTAVALLGSYGLFMQRTVSVGGGELRLGPVELSTEYLTMNAPRYEGYNADGGHFVVTARSAVQDLKPDAPIKLFDIDAKITQPNNSHTTLLAAKGSYDTKSQEFELWDSISVKSSDGMSARLSRATVLTKQSRIVSDEPVDVEMPAGSLRGNAMVIRQKEREVTFSRGVVANLKAQPRDDKPQPAPSAAGTRLLGSGSGPIQVSAPEVRIDDNTKIAVFSGSVRATQGEATLTARQLEAGYESVSGAAEPPASSASRGRLTKLFARDDVVITRGQDRITSATAEFNPLADTSLLKGGVTVTSGADRQASSEEVQVDSRADTVVMTGNVVVQQGKNVLKGRRLLVEQRTGKSQLSSPADAAAGPGRISAHFMPGELGPKNASPKQGEGEGGGFGTFRTDPNAPIDIQADVLDVNDHDRTATFRGDVHVVQGDFTIRTAELFATYTGQVGLSLGSEQGAAKGAPQLQKIYARRKVVVTSKNDQSATGDWAEFDLKSNSVVLGGDVVLSQFRNVVRGPRLEIDMVTGQSRMEAGRVAAQPGAAGNGGAGEIKGKDAQVPNPNGVNACGGRMCAVFYPKDATDAAKRGAAEAVRRLGADKEQKDQPRRGQDEPEAGSGWTPVTRP